MSKQKKSNINYCVKESTFAEELRIEEANGTLAISKSTVEDILTYDFEEDKYINYHVALPTREWLISRLFWGNSCKTSRDVWEDLIIDALKQIDPNMFITINRICFVACESDMEEVARELRVERGALPESICFDDDDPIGLFWYAENSVLINLWAIRKANEKLNEETGIANDFWTEHSGIILTLIHELRHAALGANPFLPEDLYPASGAEENAVERWARETYDSLYGFI